MNANNINNVDYLVRFRHILPNPDENGGTWCFIKIVDPAVEKEEDLKIKSIGYTTLHYTEDGRFDKSTGRRKAFAYALGMRKDVEFKDRLEKIKLITPTLTTLSRQIGGRLGRHIRDIVDELSEYTKLPLYNDEYTREERRQFWKAYNEHCKGNKLTVRDSRALLEEFVTDVQTVDIEKVAETCPNLVITFEKVLSKLPYLDQSKKKGAKK